MSESDTFSDKEETKSLNWSTAGPHQRMIESENISKIFYFLLHSAMLCCAVLFCALLCYLSGCLSQAVVLHIPDWSLTHYVSQEGLILAAIPLSQLPNVETTCVNHHASCSLSCKSGITTTPKIIRNFREIPSPNIFLL